MLEDSISCSPGNEKKLSRSRRFHRKTKRKSQLLGVEATMDDKTCPKVVPSLADLYEEPTETDRINSTQIEHFNPFQNEKILAAAERGEQATTSHKLNSLISKRFFNLNDFQAQENLELDREFSTRCPSPIFQPELGAETQFGITESEFVRFCDEAEVDMHEDPPTKETPSNSTFNVDKNLECLFQSSQDSVNVSNTRTSSTGEQKSIVDEILKDFCESPIENKTPIDKQKSKVRNSIVDAILKDFCGSPYSQSDAEIETPIPEEKNPKSKKSIVDDILEDFCGSPYSESPQKNDLHDSTPVFRFKSQTIRTYSGIRKRKSQRNINNEFNVLSTYDDGNTSDSSSLSIQEDFSQSVVPQLDTVDLNNSVKLCQNLMNLSSYFSQTASCEKSTPPLENRKEQFLSGVLSEIIELKKKRYTVTRNRSERSFLGFANEEDSQESTLKELLEDEDDVLQLINCDSLCYEKVEQKTSFAVNQSDLENSLRDVNAVDEKANILMSSRKDTNPIHSGYDSTKNDQSDCDMDEDIPTCASKNSSAKEEELFDDIDIWKDNEFLLNYKTQKQPLNQAKLVENRTCLNVSKVDILIETNNNNCAINEPKTTVGMFFTSHESSQGSIDPCSSTSLKQKATTKRCTTYVNKDKSERTISERDKADNIATNSVHHLPNSKEILPTSSFMGFATASKKPIEISDSAKRKAKQILEKFTEEERAKCLEEEQHSVLEEEVEINKLPIQEHSTFHQIIKDCPSSPSILGFSTASKKPITISNKAKQKADLLLKKFEEEENEKLNINNSAANPAEKPLNIHHSRVNAIQKESTPVPNFVGFSTASKKPIKVSDKAQQKADEILREFVKNEQKNILVESTECQPIAESSSSFVGFCTASKKPISISDKAKLKADEILKKFVQTEAETKLNESNEINFEKGNQRSPDEVSEEVKRKAQELLLDIEFFEDVFEDELIKIEKSCPLSQNKVTDTCSQEKATCEESSAVVQKEQFHSLGFQTASKKSIHISDEAKRRADLLLQKVDNEILSQEFLKCVESDLDKEVNIHPNNDNELKLEQVDGAPSSPQQTFHRMSRTNDKCLHDEKLQFECNTHEPSKLYSSPPKVKFDNDPHTARKHDETNAVFHRDPSKSLKRKRGVLNSEEMEKTPVHIHHRLSCDEKTPLNSIENGVLRRASSMPLKKSTPNSELISRKNLLSLSKRKKLSSLGTTNADPPSVPKTPDKISALSGLPCNATMTPNLKEFFDSVSTSTPRLIRGSQTYLNHSKETIIDPDFQRIQWENSNNSLRNCISNFKSDANVSLSEISPSPKERIERLKMYGEPPPISPILMVNKCRTSGLRRGRSLMKP